MALCVSAEAHTKHHHGPRHQYGNNPPAPATLTVHEVNRDVVSADGPKGCQGAHSSNLPCDAVSAKATEDQARYALSQASAAWCGVAIGLVTFAAAVFAACYAKKAADETRRSALATVRAVNATHKANKINLEGQQRQLRAYVHVSGAQVRNLHQRTGRSVVVEIKNYGSTPALKTRFRMGEHVREWPLQSILPLPSFVPTGSSPLPPGRHSIMPSPVGDLSEFEEGELRADRAAIYVWGEITYEDIFGENHVTTFRLVCRGDGLLKGYMHATEEGNDAD